MNEQEALKNLVEWFERNGTPFRSHELSELIKQGRIALDLAIEQETLKKIMDKVDNIDKLVRDDLAKVPKIDDQGYEGIFLEGFDKRTGTEVRVQLVEGLGQEE